MKSYETKANQKILKGYKKLYTKEHENISKLNEKATKGGSSAWIFILLGIVGVGAVAFGVWWFKFRKPAEE